MNRELALTRGDEEGFGNGTGEDVRRKIRTPPPTTTTPVLQVQSGVGGGGHNASGGTGGGWTRTTVPLAVTVRPGRET